MADPGEKSGRRKFNSCSCQVTSQDIQNSEDVDDLDEEIKSKRRRFSFTEKEQILEECHRKTYAFVSDKYKIDVRVLKRWQLKKPDIVNAAHSSSGCKKKMADNDEELDAALFLWIMECHNKGTPITGALVRRKALELNKALGGPPNFKASSGWLEKFQKRKNIRCLKITGEKLSADVEAAIAYKPVFEEILATKNLSRAQMCNFDETMLQYRSLPNRTLVPRNLKSVSGPKKQLDRLTVAACCNADGTFKMPLVVIGKSKNPRCLKNLDKTHLPVWYRHQSNAWMDKEIFEEWVVGEFAPRMTVFLETHKLPPVAVLLVDNCRAHKFVKVGDIEVAFLPPNVTSELQPLDQGILETTKMHYRSLMVDSMLMAQNKGVEVVEYLKTINVKDAIFWVAEAWDQVLPSTIYKCWNKLWPVKMTDASTQTDDVDSVPSLLDSSVGVETANNLDESRHGLLQRMRRIYGFEQLDRKTLLSWFQQTEETEGSWSNAEIVEQVQASNTKNMSQSQEDRENEEKNEENNEKDGSQKEVGGKNTVSLLQESLALLYEL